MNTTAYLTAMINQETGAVEDVSVYSERHPTCFHPYVFACIYEVSGDDFGDAMRIAVESYERSWPALAARFPVAR